MPLVRRPIAIEDGVILVSEISMASGRFASQFGGLWTDRDDAHEVLARRVESGEVSSADADLLRFWMANGYVILPNAASAEDIDIAASDIDLMYAHPYGFIEGFETGKVLIVPTQSRHRALPHKLLDAYALSPKIRKAVFADKIVKFMNLIFGEPALAFQGLYFERGTSQPMHQDSAYVRVSRPMEMAASWLAMEDIKPGTGELHYYVGSHRIPEFLFGGEKKWMPDSGLQHDEFLKHLVDECERRGLKKELFKPKKGDALIWSADLVHGGSPVLVPDTRRSFVTHWCPESADPMYFHFTGHSGRIKASPELSYSYSYHARPLREFAATAGPERLGKRFLTRVWERLTR